MRKLTIRALAILVPVFASLPGVGQEKPNVQIPSPEIEARARAIQRAIQAYQQALQIDSRTVQAHRALRLALQGGRGSSEDLVNKFMRYPRFQMPEGLELIVQELEKASKFHVGGDFAQGLTALDAAERAAMKARRSWRESREGLVKDARAEPDLRAVAWSPDGRRLAVLVLADREGLRLDIAEDLDPLQEAQSSLKRAVASLRKARDAGEAGRALDEVDKSVTALRVLLWERAAKRD